MLLDAHNEDQKDYLRGLLKIRPANYHAENSEKAMSLYNKTYLKIEEDSTTATESFDTDPSESHDKTFSIDKPKIKTRNQENTSTSSSSNKKLNQIQKPEKNNNSIFGISFRKPKAAAEKKETKTPTSSGVLKDRKTFKVSYEIVTDEDEDSGDEYQRDNAVDLNDCLNLVPVTPQPFPDPPVSSPVHHPGSGVSYGSDDPRNKRRINNLDLLRDHCSGRLTPCCNGGQHTIEPQYQNMEDISSLHTIAEKESIACVDR